MSTKEHSKLCLKCGERSSRRVKGTCPLCGTDVRIYQDYFIPLDEDNPGEVLVKHFSRKVRGRDNMPTFNFSKKTGSRAREINAAVRLLSDIDMDVELGKRIIDVCFTHVNIRWKKYTSLMMFVNSSDLDLARAQALLEKRFREKEEEENRKTIDSLKEREDIFGYGS